MENNREGEKKISKKKKQNNFFLDFAYYCLFHESHFVTKLRKEARRHFFLLFHQPLLIHFEGELRLALIVPRDRERERESEKGTKTRNGRRRKTYHRIVIEYCYHYRFVVPSQAPDMPTHFFFFGVHFYIQDVNSLILRDIKVR